MGLDRDERPAEHSRSKRLTRFQLAGLIFLGWTAVGLFQGLSQLLVPNNTPGVVLDKLFDCWAWALLTPLLIQIDRKLASRRTSVVRSVAVFLLLSIPVTFVHILLTGLFLYPFPQVSWSPLRNTDYVIFYFLGGWAIYCAVVGILQAVRFYNGYVTGQLRLERVERSLIESRLSELRLHLEPHFLFNALNAISSELAEDPRLARDMIGNLGALLRRSLDCQDRTEISLAEELSVLEHYLSIQRIRFGDRIKIQLDIEPEMIAAMVPSMLLQPLVENAIRHGIERRISGGKIVVSAAKAGDQLCIKVTDDGVGLPRGWQMETSTGHGVRITRERLIALYPNAGDNCLKIGRREGGGTEAVIRIPLRQRGWNDSVG